LLLEGKVHIIATLFRGTAQNLKAKMRRISAMPWSIFSAQRLLLGERQLGEARSRALRGGVKHVFSHVVCMRVIVGLLFLAGSARFSFAQEFEPREFEARAARHERHAGAGEAEARADRHARGGHGHRHHHTNTTAAIMTNTTTTITMNTMPTATATTTPAATTTTLKPPSPAGGDPTWTGGGGNVNWSTPGNWDTGAPTSSNTTALVFAGTTNTGTAGTPLNNNIANPMILNSIAFSSGGSAFFLGGNQLNFRGAGDSGTLTQSSSSSESIANAILLDKKLTLTLGGTGTGAVTISGNITEADNSGTNKGKLTVTGGTWTLGGTNTYTGATTVSGGTLLVNGSTASGSAVTVNGSGTTLGGIGTINGTVQLSNTTAGAILNPGANSTSAGTLTTGALTLSSTNANTVHIDAFGTATNTWDKVVSTAAITLGNLASTLQVNIASGLTFTPNQTYILLTGTSLTNQFNGISNNQLVTFSGYEFTAEYTTTAFELIAVPEPSTWFAAALAVGAIGYSQRRRFARRTMRVT